MAVKDDMKQREKEAQDKLNKERELIREAAKIAIKANKEALRELESS